MFVNLVENRVQTRRDRGFSRFRSFCKTWLIQTLIFRIWSSVKYVDSSTAFRLFRRGGAKPSSRVRPKGAVDGLGRGRVRPWTG